MYKTKFKMSFRGTRQWDCLTNNSSLGYTLHGGSVPNLLSPPRCEGLGTLKKRLSMEVLRGWAPDLGSLSMGLNLNLSPVKWPSLVTVCRWKQTLTEKLKKRQCDTEDKSQVRECAHARRLTDTSVLEGPNYLFLAWPRLSLPFFLSNSANVYDRLSVPCIQQCDAADISTQVVLSEFEFNCLNPSEIKGNLAKKAESR